jgi:hypothetical protein
MGKDTPEYYAKILSEDLRPGETGFDEELDIEESEPEPPFMQKRNQATSEMSRQAGSDMPVDEVPELEPGQFADDVPDPLPPTDELAAQVPNRQTESIVDSSTLVTNTENLRKEYDKYLNMIKINDPDIANYQLKGAQGQMSIKDLTTELGNILGEIPQIIHELQKGVDEAIEHKSLKPPEEQIEEPVPEVPGDELSDTAIPEPTNKLEIPDLDLGS